MYLFNQVVNAGWSSKNLESFNPFVLELDKNPYNVIITVSGDQLLFEFEPAVADEFDTQKTIGKAISRILADKTLSSLLENAAQEVKKIIHYDRVMVYRFNEDGHGEVVAEAKEDYLAPFLGLHYPASDIPKQARELYKLNLTRIIADVDSVPSAILTSADNVMPLDLTHSELRAVSPIHIQYLKNMGVKASFSISLISKGELWGLIACHNYTPKFINFKARDASKLIAQILSSALEYRQGEEDAERFTSLAANSSRLVSFIENEGLLVNTLTSKETTIKDVTSASGAAFIFENGITTVGYTPDEDQINAIAAWLFKNMQDSIYYTHRFPEIFEPAKAYSDKASGILACILSRELKEMIIWFKTERIHEVHWAGDPEKPVEVGADGVAQLSPRKSFEAWTQIVRHTSEKWNRSEITAVVNIREHIILAIKRRANEIRLLNEKLISAYDELDSFSFTVSHDLRTPLSSIKSYAELLLTTNKSLDANARNILERIRKSTDRMTFLINEVLNYARIGRVEVQRVPVDMGKVMEEIKHDIASAFKVDQHRIVVGETPEIKGDPSMIQQVFNNLVNNAVKYSAKSENQKVTIEGKLINNEIVYSVEDNGIGIDINYYSRVFELFKRMDNVEHYEGTGVGLAIVKRIVDRHEARIWFESTLGMGTTFYVAFKQ
jgi:light-regulated signal transduction histidine kinase (bacteriophytochrome)